MKSVLIFALTMIVSLVSLSQSVITINFTKTESLVLPGNYDYKKVLETGDVLSEKIVNETKVINFDKMFTQYFVDGKLEGTFLIDDCDEKDGVYTITYKERDIRNGREIKTTQIVDTKENKSYYVWYWDGDENVSCLIDEKVNTLTMK